MFKKDLTERLKRIFDFDKVTFDLPGESQEQEGVFIQVTKALVRIKDKREIARVTGTLHVFASLDKMPFGYFSKKLEAAAAADTRPLCFLNFEENKGTIRNIVERSLDFVFLFDSQFNPNVGTLTSVNLSIAENL